MLAVQCDGPASFDDTTKCGGANLPRGHKRCNWHDEHPDWNQPVYKTDITYECQEGYILTYHLQCYIHHTEQHRLQ